MTADREAELRRRIRKSALMLAGVAALFFFGFILAGVLRG